MTSSQAPGKRWLWPAVAAVFAVVGFTVWALRPKPAPRVRRFQVSLPDKGDFGQYLALSPNGRKLVFNTTGSEGGIWVRDLETLEVRLLPGTQGALRMFWSPDSRFVGFTVGSQLKKINVAGGPPQTLCEIQGGTAGSGAWNRDGVIIFGAFPGPLRSVSEAGGVPTELTAGGTVTTMPSFLPDGRHFVYFMFGTPEITGMYVGSLDAKPAEQELRRLLASTHAAAFVTAPDGSGGRLFFLREYTLMVQTFDTDTLNLTGEPISVAENVGRGSNHGLFSVSPTGALAYRTDTSTTGYRLTWLDRQGKPTGTFGELSLDAGIALSPGGTRAAVRNGAPNRPGDIWLLDFTRRVRSRFTFHSAEGSFPVWSPDGTRVAFSGGTAFDTLYEKAASGAGDEKELFKRADEVKMPSSWSPDGRFLLYDTNLTPKTGNDLWVLPLEDDRKPVLLLGTEFHEFQGSFSPDMRWIAYTSTESGRPEVYVMPFTPPDSASSPATHKWQVSKDGGSLSNGERRAKS